MDKLISRPSIPNGVIVLAQNMAQSQSADDSFFECCKRLQTSQMDDVWKSLLETKPIEGAELFLKQVLWPEVELYGLSKLNISEQACAAIFYYCVRAYREFGSTRTISLHNKKVDRYLIANDVLRELIDDRSGNDARFEPGLCESLEEASSFVVQRFRDLLHGFDPAAISNDGASASLRSAMRTIGYIPMNVFGKVKYERIAVVGNALFECKKPLTGQGIKTWFKSLRLPSTTAMPRRSRGRKAATSATPEG